jgi:hypothetical protein
VASADLNEFCAKLGTTQQASVTTAERDQKGAASYRSARLHYGTLHANSQKSAPNAHKMSTSLRHPAWASL